MADSKAGPANGSTVVVVNSQDGQQPQKGELDHTAPKPKADPPSKCEKCTEIFFIVAGVICVIVGFAVIIVAILTSISTKAYDADQSNRIAAMLLLAVSAAVSITVIIYGQVAVVKRKLKPLYVTATILVVVVIVQSLITGIAIQVDDGDKANLVGALAESFKLSREVNSRHHKIWSMTQANLECCGLHSPDDYRNPALPTYFPPDVPISCCPSYDITKSELVQEKDRAMCKAKKIYYRTGCEDPVLTLFVDSAQVVLGVNGLLICIEILVLLIGTGLSHITSNKKTGKKPETQKSEVEMKTPSL